MNTSDKNTDKQKLSQLMDGEWLDLNASDCVSKLCKDDELRAKWTRYHMIRDTIKNEPVQVQPDLASRICSAIDDEPVYSNITPLSGAGNAKQSPWAQADVQVESSSQTTDHSVVSIERNIERKPSWVNTGVAGFALAASVALVTVVGMNLMQQQGPAGGVATVADASSGIDGALDSNTAQVFASETANNTDVFSRQDKGTALPVVEFVANTGSYWVSPQSSGRVSDEQKLNMMLSQHIENSPTSAREGLLPYSRLVGYDEQIQEER